ncbi:MAG: hypothetical protein EP338_03140 [Bacteroidetes bacterium]|nr:MAG: hypothetical protein EP338_03140 [Bacteroidota bacterium]
MKAFSWILLPVLFVLSACVKNNENPTWLDIRKWTLIKNVDLNGQEGELSSNFSDVYLLIDGKVIGYFELPIKLPILEQGTHTITMYPAIRNNGISATKKVFPFCDKFEVNHNFIPDSVVPLDPVTKYSSNCKFWIEDFEDAAVKIYTDPISNGTLTSGNDPVILNYGNFYGHVKVTTADSLWLGYATPSMTLPKSGAEVYMEIDYYNDNKLRTGLIAYEPSETKTHVNIDLNAQDASSIRWKKIYIDLKEIVSNSPQAGSFSPFFDARLSNGKSEGNIYIDNIKMIHF